MHIHEHTLSMYPIDVQQLIRQGTLGSNALDPVRPHREPRRLALKRMLVAASRNASRDPACVASTTKTASARG